MQITWFVPMMLMDVHRKEFGWNDMVLPLVVCAGCRMKKPETTHRPLSGVSGKSKSPKGGEHHGHEPNKCLGECFGPMVIENALCIRIATLVFIALGAFFALQVNVGISKASTLAFDSTAGLYDKAEGRYWSEPTSMTMDLLYSNTWHRDTSDKYTPDYPDSLGQRMWDDLHDLVDERLVPGASVSWWEEFSAYHEATYPDDEFVPDDQWETRLNEWLIRNDGPDPAFNNAYYFRYDFNSTVPARATHWFGMFMPLSGVGWGTTSMLVDLYKELREQGWTLFAPELLLYESSIPVLPNMVADVFYTLLILFFVTVIFLQQPSLSWLLVICLTSIVIQVIGLFAVFGVPLNAFTEVALVISLGLCGKCPWFVWSLFLDFV